MFGSQSVLSLTLAAVSLIGSTRAQNSANKNVLFPNGLGSINKQGLFNAYPQASVVSNVKRAWGTVPKFCYSAANPDNLSSGGKYCNPYDIEVYEVTFSDCSASWTMCRCNNAPWTINDMINIFGRVPVKARQYTRILTMFGDTGTHAYAQSQAVVIFDTAQKPGLEMTIMFHENAHCVDGGSGGLSSNQNYINAINADSCVPDPYARASNAENWAQLSVLGNYDLSSTGPLSRYANPACLQRQLTYVENTVGRDKLVTGGSCTFYYVKDQNVCMGPAAGCGNAGAPVSSTAATASNARGDLPSKQAPEWKAIHDDAHSISGGAPKMARSFDA